jgi:hypothetical protein
MPRETYEPWMLDNRRPRGHESRKQDLQGYL